MAQLAVEIDGILFGYTALMGRSYKSLNYHRQAAFRPRKTKWVPGVPRADEYAYFEQCEANTWLSLSGDYWWISANGKTTVGLGGEKMAFFPLCDQHPGPWHGYPVSATSDRDYEVPREIVNKWEDDGIIDDLIAGRIRKGKL